MPQGWSIRKLSRFNVILSGGYGNRPEPTGHATYPQPLAYIAKVGMGGKLRSVGLALKWREYRHRPLELSQILLPIPPSPYGQPSPRSGGRRVPKQRFVVARTETAGGMANKICGTSARQEHERFDLVGKSRPCRGYAPAAAPTPAPTLVGGQILVPTPPSGSETTSPRRSGLCTRKF